MEIVVFGAGSLGSLVGGLLARAHDVTLVGRDPHMAAVRETGLRVEGVESFVAHPGALTDGAGLEAELAVVTVKAFDTPTAARTLATGAYEAVLSLQNGMGNEEILAREVDAAVLAGTTTHGALLAEPGVVDWTGRGAVVLGPWQRATATTIDRVAAAFETAGLEPHIEDDMRPALWRKLAVNAAINPVTALSRVENGALRTGPPGSIAHAAAGEVVEVSQSTGVELTRSAVDEELERVIEATAGNRSSMLEDVRAGRRTEIDQLNGYVVDQASGTDVPVNRVLTALVRAWEAGHGYREPP